MGNRQWGANELGKPQVNTLEAAISQLNPKAKQAMYAAANKGVIAQGTWDGCAFNAGGIEIGNQEVTSFQTAARAFDLPVNVVSNFIVKWDALKVPNPTEHLKELLLKAGLFTEPNETKGRRILRETVYKSMETRKREEFEAIVAGLDLNDSEDELVSDINMVKELLSV